jgi:hypothetical protein
LEGLGQFGFREVLLVACVSVWDIIIHIVHVKDSCALASTFPSLSMINMIYCSPETKATPASVQGVGVDF